MIIRRLTLTHTGKVAMTRMDCGSFWTGKGPVHRAYLEGSRIMRTHLYTLLMQFMVAIVHPDQVYDGPQVD